MSQLSEKDLAILAAAVSQLERPSLAGKLAAVVGMPVEKLLGWLPESIQNQIDRVTEEALAKALNVAMKTLDDETGQSAVESDAQGGRDAQRSNRWPLWGSSPVCRTSGDDCNYPAVDRRHRSVQRREPI